MLHDSWDTEFGPGNWDTESENVGPGNLPDTESENVGPGNWDTESENVCHGDWKTE